MHTHGISIKFFKEKISALEPESLLGVSLKLYFLSTVTYGLKHYSANINAQNTPEGKPRHQSSVDRNARYNFGSQFATTANMFLYLISITERKSLSEVQSNIFFNLTTKLWITESKLIL
jgi:hypothetical protein